MRKKGENSVNLRARAGIPPDEMMISLFGAESQPPVTWARWL